jgi:hypothetical protein
METNDTKQTEGNALKAEGDSVQTVVSPWEYGTLGGINYRARRHINGTVECYGPKNFEEYNWESPHRSNWYKFIPDTISD